MNNLHILQMVILTYYEIKIPCITILVITINAKYNEHVGVYYVFTTSYLHEIFAKYFTKNISH